MRKPSIYGYIRVSSEGQEESGLGMEAQESRINERARVLGDRLGMPLARILRDPAVSGRQRLMHRPQGKVLLSLLRSGDHLIIAKLDRGFRNAIDCLMTLEALEKKGVTVHIMDIDVDTSSPTGKLMVAIMAAVAQWESNRIGERIRDAFSAIRERSPTRAMTGRRVIGYGLAEDGLLEPHHEERAAGELATQMRDAGQSLNDIAAALSSTHPRPGAREWNAPAVKRLIQRARAGWPINPFRNGHR